MKIIATLLSPAGFLRPAAGLHTSCFHLDLVLRLADRLSGDRRRDP